MDLQKLKKKLLMEEVRRQRKKSKFWRFLIPGSLLGLVLLFAGLAYYLTHFDRLLEEDYVQAESRLAGGDYEKALADFETIYRRHPSYQRAPQALFQSAEILNLYLRRYQEALLAYMLVEKDFPGSEVARRAREQVAEIYKNRLRDYPRAIVAYQKLLDTGASEPDRIQYEVADTYFRLENFEQARIEFESLSKSYPASRYLPEVRYRIGVTYSLEGDSQRAVKAFREVATTWPQSPFAVEARFGLATVLEEREELQAALVELQQLVGVYPNQEALGKKLDQVKRRIDKKRRAI